VQQFSTLVIHTPGGTQAVQGATQMSMPSFIDNFFFFFFGGGVREYLKVEDRCRSDIACRNCKQGS